MKNLLKTLTVSVAMMITAGVATSAVAAPAASHPTIRTMFGAKQPVAIEAASTALIVIDYQNEYFPGGKMPIPDGMKAMENTKRLISYADKHKIPVFHIQHVAPKGAPVFAEDGDTVKIHKDIQPGPNHTLLKKTSVSVWPTTDLDARLKAAKIKTLIITGLMTHACVAGAARDASPLGYNVIVASDASATRDIDSPTGGVIKHGDLHRAALTEIADTFGDVMTTEQIIKTKLN